MPLNQFDISAPFMAASQQQLMDEKIRQQQMQNQQMQRLQELSGNPASMQQVQELAYLDPSAANVLMNSIGVDETRRMNRFAGVISQAKQMLDNGNLQGLLGLAVNSMAEIPESRQVVDSLAAGDFATTRDLINGAYSQFVGSGLIASPQSAKKGHESLDFARELDALQAQARAETDPQKRAIIEQQIENRLRSKPRTAEEELGYRTKLAETESAISEITDRRKEAGKLVQESNKQVFDSRFSIQKAQAALNRDPTMGYLSLGKSFLAKVVPGVDVEDEAALESALTQFAMQNLQSFKGPTTDFEFRVAERINGTMTDSASSIQAKLNALDVSTFLKEQYSKQLGSALRNSKFDPMEFNFNDNDEYKGLTISQITDYALANGVGIDQAIKDLKNERPQQQGMFRVRR